MQVEALALAAATCAAPSSPDTGPQGETLARQRQAFLETILYFAAGLLVAGLIAMHFLVNVPTAFYAKPPDNVSELARAIEFQLALTYSLILAGVYLPVVLALYWQQDGYAEKKSSMEEKKGAKQSFGTWLPVGSGLAHFIAILSPLLTDLVIRLLGIPMA